MPAARQYRTEHVDTKPRGWKVRTSLSGAHVLRIGYPPGRRRRGAGRLLEVLHPKAEKSNPRCQMSEWAAKAKSNPEELLIFGLGNPHPARGRKKNAVRMQIEHDPSKKQFRASMAHPRGGSWLYAWGHTKKQAAAALRDEWRKARGNPETYGYEVVEISESGKPRVVSEDLPRGEAKKLLAELRAVRDRAQGKWQLLMRRTKGWPNPRKRRNSVQRYGVYKDNVLHSVKSSLAAADREANKLRAAGHSAQVVGPRQFFNKNLGGNPVRRRRRKHNPISESEQAVKLFEIFHGEDPSKITEKHVSAAMRKDYTALGKLVAVGMEDGGYGEREIAQKWDKCSHINFSDDHVTLASSPDGRQLYAIGGNQNLNGCLDKFEGIDPEKDFIDLGEMAFVVYEARKIHDDFEPVEYVHKFGGKGRTRPGWFYDRLKKAIFFIGGEYFIDIDAKISPGIEG